MADVQKVSATKAIKDYFEREGGKAVKMDELKALTPQERSELGQLAAKELGVEIQA